MGAGIPNLIPALTLVCAQPNETPNAQSMKELNKTKTEKGTIKTKKLHREYSWAEYQTKINQNSIMKKFPVGKPLMRIVT